MRRFWFLMCAIGTLLFNWYIFYEIAHLDVWGKKLDVIFVANMFTASIAAHELGHALLAEWFGIRMKVFFCVLFAFTMPQDKENEKRLLVLSHPRRIAYELAGSIGNLTLIICTSIGWFMGIFSHAHTSNIINLNAYIILFNLIPFWIWDGGMFAKLFFGTITQEKSKSYALTIAMTVGLSMTGVFWIPNANMIGFPFILCIFWGLYFHARQEKKNIVSPLTSYEEKLWATIYTALLSLSIILFTLTTSWQS